MLFGSQPFREEVLKKVFEFAEEKKIQIIYGAVVGGISKGLQYYDSDYDTRFLFVNKDFPNEILIPDNLKEKEIVKRYYSEEDEATYEWIPCWELSSFLQYLVYPSIDHAFSTGLYNIVGWTLGTPYAWDPYGLQGKLMPLVNKIFVKEYVIDYHLKQLEKYFNTAETIVTKDYIYAVYAAMTIQWAIDYNETPPVYAETLLINVKDKKTKNAIWDLISYSKKQAKEYMEAQGQHILHSAHYNTFTTHNEYIDSYIIMMQEKAQKILADFQPVSDNIKGRNAEVVNDMYKIISDSLNEQKVRYVND